ncbi:MAG: dUTP diphosphatase [Candidatus Diapherotrites archaeon]|nr:dUTP diphosphatase [Candidatus Diapherotrites archaeon]
MNLPVQRLSPNAKLPAYAHEGDAGMDVYASEEALLAPGEIRLVSTGLCMAIPSGFEGQVRPKSGLALQHGITVLNSPGTIDAGYRGELKVILINHGTAPYKIEPGKKIAQLVIQPVERAQVMEVSGLEETKRGSGGFGSTGVE